MYHDIVLHNGVTMPAVGFGTWMLKGEAGKQAILDALAVGYRLIDTAHMYDNEAIVGQAVAESGLDREEVFITTKLCRTRAGYELARQGIEESLARLQTDYIDLLLIHEPYDKALDMYRALTEAYRKGQVRAIGISNFNAKQYLDFIGSCDIIPMVNQVGALLPKEKSRYSRNRSYKLLAGSMARRQPRWLCAIWYSRGFPSSPSHRIGSG